MTGELLLGDICIITTTSVTVRAFILPTLERLNEEGHKVTVVCSEDDQLRAETQGLCRYVGIPMRRGVDVRGPVVVLRLLKEFMRGHYSIVQYATPNASLYASVAAWVARVPVRLYAQWGIRYVGFKGAKRHVYRSIERLVAALSTDVWVASHLNMEFGIAEGLYTAGKARVLGEGGTVGVKLSEYDLATREATSSAMRCRYGLGESFVFGFVGRLASDKGIAELLEATLRLADEADVRLLCVGDNELAETGELEALVARAGSVVAFSGHVSHSEVIDLLATMDCYVHPSYREGFGMSIQEAAAMGRPIITTDIPGASEVMEGGTSCLLVPPRDAVALEHAMRRVLVDGSLRVSMGVAARARVEASFDRSLMLNRQSVAYTELLARAAQC